MRKASENLTALANRVADPRKWCIGDLPPWKTDRRCLLGHLTEILGIPRFIEDTQPILPPCLHYARLMRTAEYKLLDITSRQPGVGVDLNNDSSSHPEVVEWVYRAQALSKQIEDEL